VTTLEAAAKEDAMMYSVQARNMGLRPPGDWPFGNHLALFRINDFAYAFASQF